MTHPSRRGVISLGYSLACLLMLSLLGSCSDGSNLSQIKQDMDKERLTDSLCLQLLLAGEAQKQALLSPTAEQSKVFAEKAAQADSTLKADSAKLAALIGKGGDSKEGEAFALFNKNYELLGKVSAELLELAGRNTNLRAALLSRTEAANVLNAFQRALTPLAEGPDCPVEAMALRAAQAALNIMALHAPHIDEALDAGMDSLEARMRAFDATARDSLESLRVMAPLETDALKKANAAYAEFWRLTQEVVSLSRENSNIRGLALAMGQQRVLTASCLDDLASLKGIVQAKQFKATR